MFRVFAGQHGLYGHQNGPITEALFHQPTGLAVDFQGNLLVADCWNNSIRKISEEGHVTDALIWRGGSFPTSVCTNLSGDIFFASDDCRVHRISEGSVTCIAGVAKQAGYVDGYGTMARFRLPRGIACGKDHLYVLDSGNFCVRKVTFDGLVSTVGRRGSLVNAYGIAVDSEGDIFVSEADSKLIKRIDQEGNVKVVVGEGLSCPRGLSLDLQENLVVADLVGGSVNLKRVTKSGTVTFVGNFKAVSEFSYLPKGIAIDGRSLYVSNSLNHEILIMDYPSQWHPNIHRKFPRKIRNAVKTLMILALYDSHTLKPRPRNSFINRLPFEILLIIAQKVVEIW
jgi:hypothetical protein